MKVWVVVAAFLAGTVAALAAVTFGVSELFGVPAVPVLVAAWLGANVQAFGAVAVRSVFRRGDCG